MVEIQYLGHSFVLLKYSKINVLVDPFLSDNHEDSNFKRIVKCPVTEKSLKDIGLILLTQEFFDHCEKKTVERISKRDNALVVATQNILNDLDISKNLAIPVSGHEKKVLRGITIDVIPSHYPRSFYPVSYLIEGEGKKIFHAGATVLSDFFEEIKADVALLPIGGQISMDLVDAVKATKTMKPEYVIPIQYNTWNNIKADPKEFVQRIEKSILKTIPVILQPGESFKY